MLSQQSADDFSVKAAETGQMTLVTKSNALRKAAKDETLQLQDVEDKLNGKLEAYFCTSLSLSFQRLTSSTMAELFTYRK